MENLDLPNEGAEQTMPTEANEIQEQETEQEQGTTSAEGTESGEVKDDDPKGVVKRINKITREKKVLQRELEDMRAQIAALSKKPEVKYTREDFGDNEEAYLDYKLEEKVRQQQLDYQKRVAQHQAQQQVMEGWSKRAQEFAKEVPDFAEALQSTDVTLSPSEQELIVESEVGPELSYRLATDEALQNKFMSLRSEKARERFLIKLEAKLEQEKPVVEKKQVSAAPAPVAKPVASKGAGTADPSKMSMADYVKWRNS